MKRLKIYLDTSVISYLDHQDAQERMAETHKLWDKIKAGEFDVVISNVVIGEIEDCDKVKADTLFSHLNEVDYVLVDADAHTVEIASRFVDLGVLKQKNFDDGRHIAAAIVSGGGAIVSLNFKHIVNVKTMRGVKAITALEGYDDLLIFTPSILVGGDENDT